MERPHQLLEDSAAEASHPPAGAGQAGARLSGATRARLATMAIPLAIVGLAAIVRLWAIEGDAQNPFYDAAVRSMGLSWHNFFFGALTPEGAIAIDKPPVDLWLQVASTKLLGFDRAALALPEALGGIAAVGLLYGALARAWGRGAGALAALALAVLPIAVLTSRSDTMDSLMCALLVAALWTAVVAMQRRHPAYVMASAALVGVAFDVKLTQALIPLPALALLWWAAARPGRRIAVGAGAAVTLIAVAMAWAFMASLTPASQRPEPMGSHRTGSIYRSIFVFNGLERLTGSNQGLTPIGFRSPPGPTRLVSSARPGYASLIGLELVGAAALIAALALASSAGSARRARASTGRRARGHTGQQARASTGRQARGHTGQQARGHTGRQARQHTDRRAWRGTDRYAREGQRRAARVLTAAVIVWLATGWVLFSFMKRLEPRYLEAVSPAVAACVGLGGAYLWQAARSWGAASLCAAALAVNAAFAVYAVGIGDAGVLVCVAASAVAMAALCATSLSRVAAGRTWRAMLMAGGSLALLAAPAGASIALVESHAGDANPGGGGNQYSGYLRAHQGNARYEVAATNPMAVVGLIAQDGRPVLILRSVDGLLVSVQRLERLVREGAVRFVIIAHPCSSGRHCTPTTAWSIRHSAMVRPGLYRYRI